MQLNFVFIIKRQLESRGQGNIYIYECRWNERLKAKTGESKSLTHTRMEWGKGIPKEREEDRSREV